MRGSSDPSEKVPEEAPASVVVASEAELREWAAVFSAGIVPGTKILLEGPLGAGKSTLAKFILENLGVARPPEGSPTFALAHEYTGKEGGHANARLAHLDVYRLADETEVEAAGLLELLWDPDVTVIGEWLSKFPEFGPQMRKSGLVLREITLAFQPENPGARQIFSR